MKKQKTLEDAIKLEKISKHFNEYMEELRKLHAGKKLDETYEYDDDYYIDIPSPSYSDEEIAYIAANHLYVEDDDEKHDDGADKVNEAKNVVLKPSPNIKKPGNPPVKGDVL